MIEYRLIVSYPMELRSSETDAKVQRTVGKQAFASGAGFGLRDLEFGYSTAAARDRAAARLEDAPFRAKLTIVTDEVEME